jgi:phosphate:Na+ symporter
MSVFGGVKIIWGSVFAAACLLMGPAVALAAEAAGGGGGGDEKIDPLKMGVGALSGLVIFFFGVFEMTRGMRDAAQDSIKRILERFTRNRLAAVLTGTGVTAVVDSSSIVTIMTVGLVSSGLLAFANALGVVMGANVGTTLSSQIIAFGLTDYFGVVLVAGAILRFFVKRGKAPQWGQTLMGLGFVYLGLEQIEAAVEPLKGAAWFTETMKQLESPLMGIAVGALITAIIQSSSATIGIVIILAGQGAIGLPAGIAIMMGAELGTCIDTLASTIGQSRPAVRTGVFHFLFNVGSVMAFGWFAAQLAALSVWITPGTGPAVVARQIANAHVMFNLAGVLLFLPFLTPIARLMCRIVPERQPAQASPARREPAPAPV